MTGFIDFIRKGNLVQLAVAFVMGVAFAAVINSFVNNIISPLLGLFGGQDLSEELWCIQGPCGFDAETGVVTGVAIGWGAFLTAVITFLITAAVIYYAIVKPYERLESRFKQQAEDQPAPTEVELLAEIRDALRTQQGA